jgi:coenzyme F420-reducing hydrogenase delta subunit
MPEPKPAPRRRKAGLAFTGLTGAVTVGGLKTGTCNFFNLNFTNKWQDLQKKMFALSNALRQEANDGCYEVNPWLKDVIIEQSKVLARAGAACKDDTCKAGGQSNRRGGIASTSIGRRRLRGGANPLSFLSTGSLVIGGKKFGSCRFADVKTAATDNFQNIQDKLRKMAAAFIAEKKDGCWLQNEGLLTALQSVADALYAAALDCNAENCQTKVHKAGPNTGRIPTAPKPTIAKGGGRRKTGGRV